MYSRQRYSQHGHMGPQMMGSGPFGRHQQQMMNPYGGSGPMMGLRQPMNGGRHMMGQAMGRGQERRNGGGLLSKILGGKKQGGQLAGRQGIQGAGRAVQSGSGGVGSILRTLSNPDSVTGFLNNTQQVLKTAESFGPMIQQYGPIVKNLPMMWKLYKGFKDLPTEEKGDESITETPLMEEETDLSKSEPVKRTKKKEDIDSEMVEVKKRNGGTSMPKLYI